MSTYMTLEEYAAMLKVGDEVTIKYYSITGEKEIKEKILKITKSGTIYLRSTNCKDTVGDNSIKHERRSRCWISYVY